MKAMGRLAVGATVLALVMGLWPQWLRGRLAATNSTSMQPSLVNPAIRVEHARELFGKFYSTSVVRRAQYVVGVEQYILERVKEALPERWQSQAGLITETVISEANQYGLDPIFLLALITRESRFNPGARGQHGEIGLMQLKPNTAEWVAKRADLRWQGEDSLLDPCQNIRLGVAYIHYLRLRYDKHSLFYISAYNMGPKRLQQLVNQKVAPKEYAGHVMTLYTGFYHDLVRLQAQQMQGSAKYRLVANF